MLPRLVQLEIFAVRLSLIHPMTPPTFPFLALTLPSKTQPLTFAVPLPSMAPMTPPTQVYALEELSEIEPLA